MTLDRYGPMSFCGEWEGMQPDPRGEWVRYEDVRAVLLALRRGHCWCEMGVGHPAMQEHTPQCLAVGELFR